MSINLKNIKNIPNEVDKYKKQFINGNSLDQNINTNQLVEQFSDKQMNKCPKFMNKIDKVLYINLKHRKDRFKQINNEFTKMDIPNSKIKRIDAVHEKYNGHIGCCKSHIKALNNIIANNYKYTLVFEDDFVFTVTKDVLDKKISTFFKKYGDNWDIIQLASHYNNLNDTNIDYIKKVNRSSTSSAYIINRHFVEKLLATLKESLYKLNKDMEEFNKRNNNVLKKKYQTRYALDQYWYPLQKKSNWLLFKPYLGKQGGSANKSSIMNKNIELFTNMNNTRVFTLNC